jgi:hypothetical protein
VPDRAALTGIVLVLKSGIPWEMLPQEWNAPASRSTYSGGACARLAAGIWCTLRRVLLDRLRVADEIDWSWRRSTRGTTPAKGGEPPRMRRIRGRRGPSATLLQTERASRSR